MNLSAIASSLLSASQGGPSTASSRPQAALLAFLQNLLQDLGYGGSSANSAGSLISTQA
jgi:hypothetical protein